MESTAVWNWRRNGDNQAIKDREQGSDINWGKGLRILQIHWEFDLKWAG